MRIHVVWLHIEEQARRRHRGHIEGAPLFGAECCNRRQPRRAIQSQRLGPGSVLRRGLAATQAPGPRLPVGADDAAELRMHRRAVEAFREVFRQQFPVRLHLGDDALADGKALEPIAREALRQLAERLRERRRRVAGQVDEHEAAPGLHRDLVEREVTHVEVRRFHAPGRRHQLAGEVVGPGVVGTDDAPPRKVARFVGAQHRAPVAAGIVECA